MSVSASVPAAGAKGQQAAKAKARAVAWCRSISIYLLFCAYGAGSAWWVINASWLQLPVYQERFGLDTASKMAVGYQVGTLAVPCFILVRTLLGLFGRSISYPALIPALLLAQAAVLSLGIVDAPYLWVPEWINILGGLLGYVTDAAHQGYILTNFDVFYVGAFWIGNDIAGLYAAAVALVQEPGLGEEGRRFGPRAFYLMSLPIAPMSLLAFAYLHRVVRPAGLAKTQAEQVEAAAPVAAPGGKAEAAGAEEAAGETPLLAADQLETRSLDEKAALAGATEAAEAPHLTADQLETTSLVKKAQDVELQAASGAPPNTPIAGKQAAKEEATGRCTWVPQGLRTHPWTSIAVAAMFAWLQFGCWGVGDPVNSYACANGSPEDKGLACVAQITEASVVMGLLGKLASSAVLMLGRRCLKPLIALLLVMFTSSFALVVLAAAFGGVWSSLGGEYVVAVVSALRFLFSFVIMLTIGLVQGVYAESEIEAMNLCFAVAGQSCSVLGTILVSVIIAESGGK